MKKLIQRFDLRKLPPPDDMVMSLAVTIGVALYALIRFAVLLAGGG